MPISDRWFVLVFAFFSSVALNSALLANIVLGVSRFIPLVILPIILGLMVSKMFESPKMIVLTILVSLIISSILMSATLLTPVLFGIIEGRSLAEWFTFLSLYRVFGNILFIAFHMIASGLAGIFFWGRW